MKTVKWINAPPTAMGGQGSRPGSSKKDTEPEGTVTSSASFN